MIRVRIKSFKGTEFELIEETEYRTSVLSRHTGYEKHDQTKLFLESLKEVFNNISELEMKG